MFVLALAATSAIVYDHLTGDEPEKKAGVSEEPTEAEKEQQRSLIDEELSALFAAMAVQPGFLGNLTADQEHKLKEFWAITLKTFGIKDPSDINGASTARPVTPASAPQVADPSSAKKEKHGLFHRKKKESVDSTGSPGFSASSDTDDKYGQTKELQDILANSSPADLRAAFWSMCKKDHPDALLLRFLRARKWDVQKALAMLISTMHWRMNDQHVDDDIMFNGEGGAFRDSQSSDAHIKKEGNDFLAQLRTGKSFLHGVDKEGRPCCFVRVRLHRGGEQSEKALERYTVYVIETCRLLLNPPVETAVSICC